MAQFLKRLTTGSGDMTDSHTDLNIQREKTSCKRPRSRDAQTALAPAAPSIECCQKYRSLTKLSSWKCQSWPDSDQESWPIMVNCQSRHATKHSTKPIMARSQSRHDANHGTMPGQRNWPKKNVYVPESHDVSVESPRFFRPAASLYNARFD